MFSPQSIYDGGVYQHSDNDPKPMSPMTLGSPSPTATVQSPYLPGFLLGDKVQRSNVSPGQKMWSGNSPPRSNLRSSGAATPITQQTRTSFSPRSDALTPKMLKDKIGAPPIRRLGGDIGSSPAPSTPGKHVSFSTPVTPGQRTLPSTPAPPTSGLQSLNTSTLPTEPAYTSVLSSPPSPAQVDPFYTQGDQLTSLDSLDETCVTIFGFPAAATSYILQQFSQYGTISTHQIASEGNWMHLKYQSKLQAKKALSKNGKIFGNGIMIGATSCIDRHFMNSHRDGGDLSLNPDQTTLDTSSRFDSFSAHSSMIRPLTAAYQAARSENQVIAAGHIPHKSNNLVSKAIEYMFGW